MPTVNRERKMLWGKENMVIYACTRRWPHFAGGLRRKMDGPRPQNRHGRAMGAQWQRL